MKAIFNGCGALVLGCAMLAGCQTGRPAGQLVPVKVVGVPGTSESPEQGFKHSTRNPLEVSAELGSIDISSLFAQLNGPKPPLLIDARMGLLYRLGHLPGALSLPTGSVEKNFPQHRAAIEAAQADGRKIVFYCVDERCPDARKAATFVANQGITGVLVYEGGIHEWKEAGMPVE
jgi:rhodanese-related sulfurtransferase